MLRRRCRPRIAAKHSGWATSNSSNSRSHGIDRRSAASQPTRSAAHRPSARRPIAARAGRGCAPPQGRQPPPQLLLVDAELGRQPLHDLLLSNPGVAAGVAAAAAGPSPRSPAAARSPGRRRGRRAPRRCRGWSPRRHGPRRRPPSSASNSRKRLGPVLVQIIARIEVFGQRENPQVGLLGDEQFQHFVGPLRAASSPSSTSTIRSAWAFRIGRATRPGPCPARPPRSGTHTDGRRSRRCSPPSPGPCGSFAAPRGPGRARRAACSW